MNMDLSAYRNGAPARTMGSETEYTTELSQNITDKMDLSKIAYMHDEWNVVMHNGARIYKDFGGLLEYATPECNSGSEVLLHERVGELAVHVLGDIRTDTPSRHAPVYKRSGYANVFVADETGKKQLISGELTTGHHENYQTGLTQEEMAEGSPQERFLNAYLATRIVWSGTGLVSEQGYNLSQKAEAINFRGDDLVHHGSKIPYRFKGNGLLEIRTGEGNMSDWAIRTKFDMTSLVLRMIEHNNIPRHLLIMNGFETSTMRAASINPVAQLPSNQHESFDAIGLQHAIASKALWFAEKHPGIPKHEIVAAKEVREACSQIRAYYEHRTELSTISDRIDWAAKLEKLRSRDLGRISCANLVAVYHDLAWEDVAPDGPSRRWYRKFGRPTYGQTELRQAGVTPPAGRARTRMDLLNHYQDAVKTLDWDVVSLTGNKTIDVDSPCFDIKI